MTIIRRLSFFDASKLKKMIAFLGNDEAERFIRKLMSNYFSFFHQLLPLGLKFLPESYVLEVDKTIHGVITVSPTKGNPYKLSITKLLFEQDYYEVGKQLIDFIITKYGAKGAETFVVSIDNSYEELLQLFTVGCGFRQCAGELLYKIPKKAHRINRTETIIFRPFKNSDAEKVCDMYNHSVVSHFKPSLLKNKAEFKESVLCGLSAVYELKYIMEETNSKTILSYFSIITADNINYTATITIQDGYNVDYSLIFGFINRELRRRKKDFNLFVKVLKYVKDNEQLEEYLKRKDGVCIGTQLILVKDFYKLIKEPSSKKLGIVLFNDSSQTIRTNFETRNEQLH